MDILITNDDGIEAPGLRALFDALTGMGDVHVVAPVSERSACSHMLTLKRRIAVEQITHCRYGLVHAVDGTPADCVRLAVDQLVDDPIGLVVSGINRGANAGVDTYYSGTVAGAREGAILGIPSIAISQSVREGVEIDWTRASDIAEHVTRILAADRLPGPGFWNVNLPLPIPEDARDRIQRVPVAVDPAPLDFRCVQSDGRTTVEYEYGPLPPYWSRQVIEPSDFSVVRDGGVAVSAVALQPSF